MSPREEIEIVPMETVNGDAAFFCRGHVDKERFLDLVNGSYGEEFEIDAVRHTFVSATMPERLDLRRARADTGWWLCRPDDLDAFPATYIDEVTV